MRCLAVLALGFCSTLLACSSDTGEPSAGCQTAGVDYTVSESEVAHACSHAPDGPFDSLQSGEEVANLHTFYTLGLSEEAPGSYVGTFSLTARKTATHSFYWSVPVDVQYRVAGEDRCVAHSQPTAGCSPLPRLDLVDLVDKETVLLEIGPTSEASVALVAERR